MKQNIVPIILAGGRGTRMRTEYPKPLHEILGKPMIGYILDSIKEAGLSDPVVVVGYKSDVVRKALPGVKVVTQTKALGSADAVKIALASFRKDPKDVLILCGDAPFVRAATIKKTVAEHRRSASSATVMTA
ncbi:MAG: NTP transferase domain-containing protein, partial [Candidatus Omnitrophota bacterium]